MLSARPNLNGNTERDFQDAFAALTDARHAIESAARVMLLDVVNGRNYQHLADADDALIRDRRRVHKAIQDAVGLMGELQSDLADILETA